MRSNFSDKYINAIRIGTDPTHPDWGETAPYDQRLVEMAAYGLGLTLLQEKLTDLFSEREVMNLHAWLNQITDAEMPDSNWNYFAIMVQLGFKRAGLPYDQSAIDRRLVMMDAYYLGDGWHSDGAGRPKDYYISMAFHFYGLIYATLMVMRSGPPYCASVPASSRTILSLASAADGASIPFGRSLTYRFAMVAPGAQWHSPGWRCSPPASLRDHPAPSALVATAADYRSRRDPDAWVYPNLGDVRRLPWPALLGAENDAGILALPEAHPFWQAEEQPLPPLAEKHVIPKAQQILIHAPQSQHVTLLTAGQLELNNYVNTEAKYTKFAYSSRFGFTIERGRYGLKHASATHAAAGRRR